MLWYGDGTLFVEAYGVSGYAHNFSEARELLEKSVDQIEAEYPLLAQVRKLAKELLEDIDGQA